MSWCDNLMAPGKPLDNGSFFSVIGVNNPGSFSARPGRCRPTPGATARLRPDFPVVTVEDWVDRQARLLDALGTSARPSESAEASAGCSAGRGRGAFPTPAAHCIAVG